MSDRAPDRHEPAVARHRDQPVAARGHDAAEQVGPAPPPLHRYLGNLGVAQLAGRSAGAGGTRSPDLERAADEVAVRHAGSLAQEHGWFTPLEGLGVDHARHAVGEQLGSDLSDVGVVEGRLPGAPADALASARSRVIHVAPVAFHPRTPIGQALLAHELAHVVQQSADGGPHEAVLPPGPSAAHADRGRPVGSAPPGMAQHSISCSSCEQPAPAPAAPTVFADVARTFRTTADPAARTTALTAGITTARGNASKLYRSADKPPVSTLRQRYETETGTQVKNTNPFIGVSQDHVE